MPDLDVFERKIAKRWKKVFAIIWAGGSPEETANAVRFALTMSLRYGYGLPGLESLTNALDKYRVGNISETNIFEKLHSIERENGYNRHTRIAVRATQRLIVEIANGFEPSLNSKQEIVQYFLNDLIEHHSFDRFGIELIGNKFTDYNEMNEYEEKVKINIQPTIMKLSSELIKKPTGEGIRTPHNPINIKRSTCDLLNTPI